MAERSEAERHGLREVSPRLIAQREPGIVARWFRGDESELFVWLDAASRKLVGCQFRTGEEILTWSAREGWRSGTVDDGEAGRPGPYKMAPLIEHDKERATKRLSRLRASLERQLSELPKELDRALRSALRNET